MRWKQSIISFLFAFTMSVAFAQWQSVVDWLWPSFDQAEVAGMVGRSVRYRQSEKFTGHKCPAEGFCKRIVDGEQGVVVGLERVRDGGYFLIVRWNQPDDSEDYLSYFGRYTRRESLEE